MEGPAMLRGFRFYIGNLAHQFSNQFGYAASVHSEFEDGTLEYNQTNIERHCERILDEVLTEKENALKNSRYGLAKEKEFATNIKPLVVVNPNLEDLKLKEIDYLSLFKKSYDLELNVKGKKKDNAISLIDSTDSKRNVILRRKSTSQLFNECHTDGICSEDGLEKAINLRDKVLKKKKTKPISIKVYNSMLKAFGMCNDLNTVFEILDEMVQDGMELNTFQINLILQCCLNHSDEAFHHSIMVWQEMRKRDIRPTISSYNLMLQSLQKIPELYLDKNPSAKQTELKGQKVFNKLLFIGGLEGILRNMKKDLVKPTLQTFQILFNLMPSTYVDEEAIIEELLKHNMKLDNQFFITLIQTRTKRMEFDNVLEILSTLERFQMKPDKDIIKAISDLFKSIPHAIQLLAHLQTSQNLKDKLLEYCLESLVLKALESNDFMFLYEILRYAKEHHIILSKDATRKLKTKYKTIQLGLNSKQDLQPDSEERKLFVLEFNNLINSTSVLKDKPWNFLNS